MTIQGKEGSVGDGLTGLAPERAQGEAILVKQVETVRVLLQQEAARRVVAAAARHRASPDRVGREGLPLRGQKLVLKAAARVGGEEDELRADRRHLAALVQPERRRVLAPQVGALLPRPRRRKGGEGLFLFGCLRPDQVVVRRIPAAPMRRDRPRTPSSSCGPRTNAPAPCVKGWDDNRCMSWKRLSLRAATAWDGSRRSSCRARDARPAASSGATLRSRWRPAGSGRDPHVGPGRSSPSPRSSRDDRRGRRRPWAFRPGGARFRGSRAEGLHRTKAAILAGDVLEQIVSKPFNTVAGSFNDILDYNGYTEAQGQVKDAAGNVLSVTDPAYAKFGRSVTCENVYMPQQIGNSLTTVFIRVTVRVSYGGSELVSLTRLVSQ